MKFFLICYAPSSMPIAFNRPFISGREVEYVRQACENRHLSGDGPFTAKCEAWLTNHIRSKGTWLTPSGTDALEMAAILADIEPGDEVIMPSYTFSSTANAFALRGAQLVFVDVRADTLNINEDLVEAAVTPRTKAIVPVHYAGVACEMRALLEIARRKDLFVIEDAAHGLVARQGGRELGSFGQLAALSFHETKNIICGEGGALIVNDERLKERAEIVRQKGTNRAKFLRGEVDKYTWVGLGSSFVASELTAAFLWAQLEQANEITRRRLDIWERYYAGCEALERNGLLRRPVVPIDCVHNGHMFYVLLPTNSARDRILAAFRREGIQAIFHYVPLHSAPAGLKYGRTSGRLPVTDDLSERILRLPLWVGMDGEVDRVLALLSEEAMAAGRCRA